MAETSEIEKPWLLLKRGLYWRPNARGCTGRRDKAGRYTTKDMLAYCANEGVSAIHEDAALPLAPNCSQEVALEYANEQIARLEAEVERLSMNLETAQAALEYMASERDAAVKEMEALREQGIADLEWARHEITALCEATEDDPSLNKIAQDDTEHKRGAYARGRLIEAKGIRRPD